MNVHQTANTDKDYRCVSCGAPGNIIREAPSLEATRVKCQSCGLLYFASDSVSAQAAGQIPDGAPELQDPTPEPTQVEQAREIANQRVKEEENSFVTLQQPAKLPRQPAYVIMSKDRLRHEFVTEKLLMQSLLQWQAQGKKYDVFQLIPKKVSAKINIL